MMTVMIILLLLILLLLVILSFIWPPDSPWAPRWRTKRDVARIALKLAKVDKNDELYELGCGDGEVVLSAARDFGANATGIEIDPVRALIARVRVKYNKLSSKVKILRKDFKQVDLSEATIIYMYLVPSGIKKLIPKFKDELPTNTKIISYRYKLPLEKKEQNIRLVKEDSTQKIYIYNFTKST